jgi:hypothetical protein
MFIDQNGVNCFIDQVGETTWIDQNSVLLTCGAVATGSFNLSRIMGR